ncbi:hypothetical protein FPC831_520008 [Flavobacterium psychrophilum]|nr:hypothetical protein FPC831_520008 [Flavobacterium psychrophilum]
MSPEYIPVSMPMRVIPICTVDRNLFGELAKSKAVFALVFPFFAADSSRFLRADINAISDIENTPFKRIKKKMMSISTFC